MVSFRYCMSCAVLTFAPLAFSDTWTVDDNGTADFSSIQDAIEAANNGDEILVHPGTYTGTSYEVINLYGKTLSIRATGSPEETILDGENERRVVQYIGGESAKSLLHGFTVTRGLSTSRGAGIAIGGNANPTISNCIITQNNSNGEGGGIACSGPTQAVISNCTIDSNTSSSDGGGIYCLGDDCSVTLSDCVITNNTASSENIVKGGGIAVAYSDNVTISNCTFSGNEARSDSSAYGGGIYLNESSNSSIVNCEFIQNAAIDTDYNQYQTTAGGGIACNSCYNFTISDCTISGNNGGRYGGGIRIAQGDNISILNSTISENSLPFETSYGGGIDIVGATTNVDITNCVISNNSAALSYGGVSTSYQWQNISNSLICGNTAAEYPQITPSMYNLWTDGGNVCIADECGFCDDVREVPSEYYSIQSAINAAEDGDTILVAPGTYTAPFGENRVFNTEGKALTIRASGEPNETILDGENTTGVILINSYYESIVRVEGFTITNGFTESVSGAGISLASNVYPIFTNCIITNNNSSRRGAGVFANSLSNPSFVNCEFSDNAHTYDYCSADGGGALFFAGSSDPTFTDCTFVNNSTSCDGGALYFEDYCEPVLTDCIISDNSAGRDGGGIFGGFHCAIVLDSCTLENNVAANEGGALYMGLAFAQINDSFISGNTATNGSALVSEGNEYVQPTFTGTSICGNGGNQIVGLWIDGGGMCISEDCLPCVALYVPNQYNTVQKAINVAQDGDIILVAPGTYTGAAEDGYVANTQGKQIVIRAIGTPEETILDGELQHTVIQCDSGEDPYTVIEGFTITRGYAQNQGGGGIYCADQSSPRIVDCKIVENKADYGGGGIYCYWNCYPVIIGCTISNNVSHYVEGGGLYSAYESMPSLENTIVCGNEPTQIEGPWFDFGDGNTVSDQCPGECPEDLNNDSVVNVHDLLNLIADWGYVESPADFNADNKVDVHDLLILIAAWGACP